MKSFLRRLLVDDSPSFYQVSRDGALVLDRQKLADSKQMDRQVQIVRVLRQQSARSMTAVKSVRRTEGKPRSK